MILHAPAAVLPDGDGGLRVGPATVTVDGAWIVDVRPGEAPGDVDDRLDGHLLTPAFVAPHTHLALAALRGTTTQQAGAGNVVEDWFFRVERAMAPADIEAFTYVGAIEALLHGVATVWEHYYAPDAVARALTDAGLAGVIAPPLQDLGGPGAGQADAELERTVALAGRSDLAARAIGAAVGPHAVDTVSDALWGRIAALADAHALPVHTHVAQSLAEVRRVHARSGRSPLGHLHHLGVLDRGPRWLLVHALYATDADLAALDPGRHLLIACPRAMAHAGFPPPVDVWEASGAAWAVAPDAPAGNDAIDPLAELAAIALLRTADVAADPALAAWRAAGRIEDAEAHGAARDRTWAARGSLGSPDALLGRVWGVPGAAHPALPCGAIAPGHLAHLAVWDLRHPAFWPDEPLRGLALGQAQGALAQVMVAGRWRTARGEHGRMAEDEEVQGRFREARERLAGLLARVG